MATRLGEKAGTQRRLDSPLAPGRWWGGGGEAAGGGVVVAKCCRGRAADLIEGPTMTRG